MKPFWQRLLTGFARAVLPEIWEAIQTGDSAKAARLASLAAQRQAEHMTAEKMLNEAAKRRKTQRLKTGE